MLSHEAIGPKLSTHSALGPNFPKTVFAYSSQKIVLANQELEEQTLFA